MISPASARTTLYLCLPALSIHQLAAQGEMVFLASRIEQGKQLLYKLFTHLLVANGISLNKLK